ncbi:MAG: glycosyl transferase [Burkholderiales bacterium RIFCSPLOWO2_02_FULL_57_36]|nr:MAG: glycosyl transferase [Burkholderiales bacterium RIFCSPLOWO2_02_FULL_57_36]
MSLSIVVPVLNEAPGIARFLSALSGLRARGAQLIVVDGGSSDGTPAFAAPFADLVVHSKGGRANQMNAGAAQAQGDALLFLHADTILPPDADALISAALADCHWGRFDIRFDGTHPLMSMIAAMMNLRSRVTGIVTGDQAMFVRRDTFSRQHGFAAIPLMEDIELSSRLKRIGRPACLRQCVTTSSRRWEKHGVWRTIFLMWRLRLAYFFGTDPRKLALAYGYRVSE